MDHRIRLRQVQDINRYIEAKMERVQAAKRIVEFKVTLNSLTIKYVIEDPQTEEETLIKERISGGEQDELEVLRQRLIERYLDA